MSLNLIGNFNYTSALLETEDAVKIDIKRPILNIDVINEHSGKNIAGVPCLVDSGADFCMISSELCELFGHDLKTGKPVKFEGIGGEATGYFHSCLVEIKGYRFKCDFCFSEDAFVDTPILGQRGFFSSLVILFDHENSVFGIYKK